MNGKVGSGKNPERNILLVGPKSDDHQVKVGILTSPGRSYLKWERFFDSLSLMLIDQEIGFDLFKAKVDASACKPSNVLTNLNVASGNQP